MNRTNDPVFQFPLLKGCDGLLHFTTTRKGGVSSGEYESLNLGEYCGDNPEAVIENRRRLCRTLSIPGGRLFAANQVHGSQVLEIDEAFMASSREQQYDALQGVDAIITQQPNLCIAVTTADCVPVLLYAPDKKVIAAVHAGWRGTVLQIVPKVVNRLVEQYGCDPQQIIAGIGPSISQANYEVGEEVVDAFRMIGSDPERIVYRDPETGKPHVDLWEANRLQLLQAGLFPENIDLAALCTFSNPTDFFSARLQGLQSGRMLTGILRK